MRQNKKSVRRKLLFTFFRQNWNIGVTEAPIHEVSGLSGLLKQKLALDSIFWMEEKRGVFRADPFPIIKQNEDGIRIFHEACDWNTGRGRIDYIDFCTDTGFGEPVESMVSSGHLSYPFVFENDGVTGYIPEHSSMRNVSFFLLDENGIPKERIEIIPNSDLIDSTIVQKDGILWLFATISGATENSELHIYYADSLRGPWLSHEANPVKVDAGASRPAGSAFFYQNSLFRPSQDCTNHYGSGIIINEIEVLNKNIFREKAVSEIRLESDHRYDFGIHTLSSAGGFTVLDGARLESKIHPALDSAQHLFRKLYN
jgi:hypothetical protein